MITLFKMAYRDLGRNRRRSFFSSLALGMGLALLMLMAAVIAGEMRSSLESSIKLQSGHLQVQAKSYDEDKSSLAWEDLIENPDQLAAQIATLQSVKVVTPRLFASGIAASGDKSFGVSVVGIDPSSPANDPYREGLVSGDFLTNDDREGVLIGQSLAEKLGLKSGDSISLLVNTSNGDVDQQMFTIRGTYATGIPAYDQSMLFMPLTKLQAITRTENHASILFVMLYERDQAGEVMNALKTDQYKVTDWVEMNVMLTEFENYANSLVYVLYLVVLAITATVIINTLVMAVFERTREIGILSAVGMRSGQIMLMFFIESSLLAVGGILMGLILGALLVIYATNFGFYIGDFGMTGVLMGERIYAYLTVKDTVTLSILAFVVTLLGSLYPALLAARMQPVEALHGGK